MYLGASPLVSSQVRQGGRTATTPHPFFFLSPRPSVRVHITSPRSLSLSLTIRFLSLSLVYTGTQMRLVSSLVIAY